MVSPNALQNPRVVIIGAGFGGLSAAKRLAESHCRITLIDRHNYHLFQPLLYQVATAALSPADIASPIRGIVRHCQDVNVILANVSGIDVDRREVIAEGHHVPFDTLIIATGAQHAYFGHDDWAGCAPGLKTIDDATYLPCFSKPCANRHFMFLNSLANAADLKELNVCWPSFRRSFANQTRITPHNVLEGLAQYLLWRARGELIARQC